MKLGILSTEPSHETNACIVVSTLILVMCVTRH